MALIVQKFGGTSVGSIERILQIAKKIVAMRQLGHELVVVVSAMGGETDRLVELAHKISDIPDPREFDVLLATGEQVTIALLSLALLNLSCPVRSYTGAQVPIRTDNAHNKAHILGIDSSKIKADLLMGKVVVVAGFQGIDEMGNITTLGRGGSDTTAVALAAALKADECQIFTDVDGVYTVDPKLIPDAALIPEITVEEMLELASNGAKVMQSRAVEFAGKSEIPVRVLSTFQDGHGTLIANRNNEINNNIISGIAFNRDEAKLVIHGVVDEPGLAAAILGPIGAAHIEVDMIVQTMNAAGAIDLAFTVHKRDFKTAMLILEKVVPKLNVTGLRADERVAKISLVGVGMRSHAGVASQMFAVLGKENINIQLISTSEIKISVLIDEQHVEKAVHALHEAFYLSGDKKIAALSCRVG